MSHLYQQYRALELDGSWIGLEAGNATPWFCTPIGAEIIGWDGAIHYCFVPGFAETVFCVNPENYGGHLVYPIARSFADFLSLLLAVGHTNSLQQVIGWKREEFERFLRQQEEVDTQQPAGAAGAQNHRGENWSGPAAGPVWLYQRLAGRISV